MLCLQCTAGTLVMIYMLKLLDSGQPELDVSEHDTNFMTLLVCKLGDINLQLVSDPTDIRLSDESDDVER